MKKLLGLLILLLLLPAAAFAAELSYIEEALPETPQWTAEIRKLTRIRKEKNMNSRNWLGRVPAGAEVNVYLYLGDWCVCEYKGDVGYLPYDRLWAFRKIGESLLPTSTPVQGIATMTQEAFLTVDKYSGNTVKIGDLLCVQADGTLPMLRRTTSLPEDSFTFAPFVSVEDSAPGDAIYGFTTFYNKDLGGRYPENRDFNIELAVERLQGVTIQPGEKFSFNALCGPYKKSNGYLKAKNVSNDGYGYGGGVCQVSTTIFCAIGGIDYTLDEWQLHSYEGVKYVPRNLDAAVASTRDFSFYNNEAIPLKMEVMAQDGVLTVILRHAQERSDQASDAASASEMDEADEMEVQQP